MHALPPAWDTDLAILEHNGSSVTVLADHLLVRTPANPNYHWGNFVMVTDPDAVDDAGRWLAVFADAFPEADWVAIGLPAQPTDVRGWHRNRIELEDLETLTTTSLTRTTPCPAGYRVRPFGGRDWQQDLARTIANNLATGDFDQTAFATFATEQSRERQRLVERGLGAWFGAFLGDDLVADLGIVRCGARARFQDVSTDPRHRRLGLASHLLGVAARWAGDHGCTELVIVTESANAAGRVYRNVGFQPQAGGTQAYRKPALPST